MGQEDSSTNGRGGKHFTYEQRVRMDALVRVTWPLGKKVNFAELGRMMGKARSTVRREYACGNVPNKDTEERWFYAYSAEKGQQEAGARGAQKVPRVRLTNRIAALLVSLITGQSLSPYAARAILLREGVAGLPCVRSIYYAVESGDLGITRESLPYRRRGKKKSVRGRRMAYTNRTGRSITERPPEAEDRNEYGHWEMDTVVGGMGASPFCLLVLTERMTRSQIIVRLPDRTQKSVVRALDRLERSTPGLFGHMRSLTCDNGCEFLDSEMIERSAVGKGSARTRLYFAHPFSAFERGANENANRIIRRFIPKGADIGTYTLKRIKDIENWMNRLPRESLGGRTAAEAQQEDRNKLAA